MPQAISDCTLPVLTNTYTTESEHIIGMLTLNDAKALNALSVDMCALMLKQLQAWQEDEKVVAVVLRGSGDKAFCAGGNIRKLYDSMTTEAPFPNPYAEAFFGGEYQLYRFMKSFTKPIILWGNGIIMGGGMGLMAMCSHRIVTESTRFAMPEITIGLFPDATGSWFLQHMPAKTGLFLGLTGAQCNAADAIFTNLAEFVLPSTDFTKLLDTLIETDWKNNTGNLHSTVSNRLSSINSHTLLQDNQITSNLAKHWQNIHRLMNLGDIHAIDNALRSNTLEQEYQNDKWFSKALGTYAHGCPVTAAITFELFQRVKPLSLSEVLYTEFIVALHCAKNPDFREGVRALLIDKDKQPKWSKTLAECTRTYINSHFETPYQTNKHPFDAWF